MPQRKFTSRKVSVDIMSYIGYSPFMLFLDKFKLETFLRSKGISINKLADSCGISRQSIYNMYESLPVFNTTFEKIRQYLNVDFRAITSDSTLAHEIMKKAPDKIKISAYVLNQFSENNNADLLLFNSGSNDKFGKRFDWNFAVYFCKKDNEKKLYSLRQEIIDKCAPYNIEIVNLNRAPLWFKLIIKNNYIRLYGHTPEEKLFYHQ